jgi:GT2 family glycosyltransferase
MSDLPVSVVVASNGRPQALRDTLEGLRHQDHSRFEVVVVVGPDRDGYTDLREEGPTEVVWLSCDERSAAAARNHALAEAAGEVVAFLDDDAVPVPWWLSDLQSGLAEDDAMAGCGGPLVGRDGVVLQEDGMAVTRSGVPQRLMGSAAAAEGALTSPESWLVYAPSSCNSAYRRAALEDAGGFDESFAHRLGDADLAVRLVDRGWRLCPVPRALVHHRSLANAWRDADGTVRDWAYGLDDLFRFARRHGLLEGAVARTWAEVSAHVDHLRSRLHADIANGDAPAVEERRFDEAVEAAASAAGGGASAAREFAGPVVEVPAARGAVRAYPSWGRIARRRDVGRRRHLCLVLEDDRQRAVCERMARDLVRAGDVVRVIRRGTVHRVRPDRGVWFHDLPAPGGDGGAAGFWAACRIEMSRIDGMHPLDEWSPASSGEDTFAGPGLAASRLAGHAAAHPARGDL